MSEYKFPDEIDDKDDKEKDEALEQIELEIEDDTPEEDRNKPPLPKDVKEDLYNDELEDYSTKVKKKLIQMKRLAHDERREKEAALREQQEAITLAQRVIEENKRLKSTLSNSEKNVLSSVQRAVTLELEAAKKAYREAYDSGDTDKVMEAQERLTDAALKADKVKNFRPAPLQTEEFEVQTQTKPEPRVEVDNKAVAWQKQNTWFGEDKLMTGMALALHEQLKEEGVALSSAEYYRRIDDTMRKRFPEKFESDEAPEDSRDRRETRGKPSTVVAPASRSTSSKRVRLTQSQMNIAKKLNLTPEQYAHAVLKLEA
jgi:uncharacterized protein (UPF0335 family)